MSGSRSRGRDRLVELASDLEEKNAEGTLFIPESRFLAGFDEVLLDEVLDELYRDPHAPDQILTRNRFRQRILDNFRLCLAILSTIGRQGYIFRFCENLRVGDDKIPIPNEILLEIDSHRDGSHKFATAFYRKQFMFKPLTFGKTMRGTYMALPSEMIVPVIQKTPLKDGQGGWSVVYEIEIHSDYDKLNYSPQSKEKPHVYACKQLRKLDADGEEEGDKSFHDEINIQYAIQGLSPNILPLLAAYKYNNRYRMIFPRADHSLRYHIQEKDPPNTLEKQWAFLKQVLGIVDALHAIHDHKDTDAKEHATRGQDQGKTIGSHRDLALQNILVKGDRLLLADFGEAQLRSIKPGEDTGSKWVWGPSTYKAPECIREKFVGRGGDIWSLACIISEILTFLLLGKEGCDTYSNSRRVDKRDSFHDNYSLKEEVIKWFKNLEYKSGQSKVVVDILKLLQEMLHQNPKSRPTISVVKERLSEILKHQRPLRVGTENLEALATEPESVSHCDDGANILDELAPRTSKDRLSVLSKLFIPFTNFTMPWTWSSPTVMDSQIRKAEANEISPLQGDAQIPGPPARAQSHPVGMMTNRPPPQAPKFFSSSNVKTISQKQRRDSMAPRTILSDPLEGPLQALRGYDTVFLVDDSNINENHWLHMGQVLINLASVAMELDPDGIDVRFVESIHCEVDDVKTWREVADSFCSVQPCERRLVLGDRVGKILGPYIKAQFEIEETYKHKGPSKFKTRLNLIVLTDGQLDDGDDLDQVIIDCVKQLDDLRAPSGSIGVQFVLFGRRDSPRSSLFEFLDDEVASEIGSRRDIVDTTEFSREMLEDPKAFKKILCGAINKKLDGSSRGGYSSTDPGNSFIHRRGT